VREIVYLDDSIPASAPDSALAERAARQIERYLADPAAPFELPLADVGTPFQRRVWQVMCEIPLGSVLTYGALARQIGGVPRAVGQACGDNPFPLVIPCHRVIAGDGSLGGFGGGLPAKQTLLALELGASAAKRTYFVYIGRSPATSSGRR